MRGGVRPAAVAAGRAAAGRAAAARSAAVAAAERAASAAAAAHAATAATAAAAARAAALPLPPLAEGQLIQETVEVVLVIENVEDFDSEAFGCALADTSPSRAGRVSRDEVGVGRDADAAADAEVDVIPPTTPLLPAPANAANAGVAAGAAVRRVPATAGSWR